jgi:hypothetical protein
MIRLEGIYKRKDEENKKSSGPLPIRAREPIADAIDIYFSRRLPTDDPPGRQVATMFSPQTDATPAGSGAPEFAAYIPLGQREHPYAGCQFFWQLGAAPAPGSKRYKRCQQPLGKCKWNSACNLCC